MARHRDKFILPAIEFGYLVRELLQPVLHRENGMTKFIALTARYQLHREITHPDRSRGSCQYLVILINPLDRSREATDHVIRNRHERNTRISLCYPLRRAIERMQHLRYHPGSIGHYRQ